MVYQLVAILSLKFNDYLHNSSGRPGWGIAWFINDTIIPELVVERGRNYKFLVYGGDDPADASNYHPFYITDSISGGRLLNSQEERAVSNKLSSIIINSCSRKMQLIFWYLESCMSTDSTLNNYNMTSIFEQVYNIEGLPLFIATQHTIM